MHVTVTDDDGSRTEHDMYIGGAELLQLCPGGDAEKLATKTFEFLLSREPKEAILREFSAMEVDRYFPGYTEEIARLCGNREDDAPAAS